MSLKPNLFREFRSNSGRLQPTTNDYKHLNPFTNESKCLITGSIANFTVILSRNVENKFLVDYIINSNFKPNFDMIEKGIQAPDFSYAGADGKERKLSDLKGRRVVLYFYPKDSTPGCTAEACDFRDNYHMWIKKGYEVIGISADSEASHQKFAEKYSLPFPLVSDPEKEIIKAYGVWGPKKFMGRTFDGILRTTFLIDAEGKIEEVITKVDTKASTAQILELLK